MSGEKIDSEISKIGKKQGKIGKFSKISLFSFWFIFSIIMVEESLNGWILDKQIGDLVEGVLFWVNKLVETGHEC